MPFRNSLSGLNAATLGLRTTANNIANASTTGFKGSRAQFADMADAGVQTSRVSQQLAQGNVQFTNSTLDAAIGGEGYFVLSDDGASAYTRAGEFGVDAEGYVVNSQGHRLQAYPADSNGQFNTGAPTDLRLSPGTEVSIDSSGVVFARLPGAQSTQVAKVALATFANPQGLQNIGDTAWAESSASGAAVLGEAGTASFGSIQAGALETSNVDLTEQFVNMMKYARQVEMQASALRTAVENEESVVDALHRK